MDFNIWDASFAKNEVVCYDSVVRRGRTGLAGFVIYQSRSKINYEMDLQSPVGW